MIIRNMRLLIVHKLQRNKNFYSTNGYPEVCEE